ncbi:MAG: SHOCT domain-containing protein [Candidatus Dojkabacteria bacterium]
MKHKVSIVVLVIVFSLVGMVSSASAHGGDSRSGEEVIDEILLDQGVEEVSDLDCDLISDDEFEELGESVMSLMHPDDEEHELMDQMMGGEGSESLRARHIIMGRSSLGCSSISDGAFGMMGTTGFGNMMGIWGTNNSVTQLSWLVLGGVVVAVLGFAAVLMWAAMRGSRGHMGILTPIELLKQEYAAGNISKKEFDSKKKDLKS